MFIVLSCQLSVTRLGGSQFQVPLIRSVLLQVRTDYGQPTTDNGRLFQSSIIQMTPCPLVQNKKTPHARPAYMPLQEASPHLPDCAAIEGVRQRRRNGVKLRYYLCLERALEPILPR